eukprot:TRINITY_DN956_c0_g1_i5.p1 TRINITY_DN956_c0_g1~~TRINITY_DN956_c0_g1_i5.p1  ORF type:complete len:104 (-),score=0.98 TRINITY_DN956_c0_g1_i5:73-384(-)
MRPFGRLVYLGMLHVQQTSALPRDCEESGVDELFTTHREASYRYRGDVQIVADCVIMHFAGVGMHLSDLPDRIENNSHGSAASWCSVRKKSTATVQAAHALLL